MLNKSLINQIQSGFKTEPRVVAGYVLGSVVRGEDRDESDFDMAVVVENKKRITDKYVYQLLFDISFPKDLDLSVVDKQSSPLFLFQMISTGTRIYERSQKDAARFEAYALHNYYDTQHMRNIYNSYLKQKFS